MTTPRIPPGGLRELGPINWAFATVAAKAIGVQNAHIFSTLGRSRGLFRAWLYFSARQMPFGTLSRKDSEMVIIRVAHLRGSEYELDHHRRLGKRAGLSGDEIERILAGPDAGWGDRERAILRAVDELVADKDISELAWAALRRHLDERHTIAFVLLVGQYDSLATTLHTLRVQPDTRV
ncbi:carboxymuconolactone decarboxylase family protein [Gordonia desulfuricans]|uniref:Carboxymuconolactone decarboxylase family protein n=1 Tax=Gordonia desulfuricans TaxID=89051 RepID=A0A7K3LJE1_9ACTN|nr:MULTISPECIES: carboxymuconolactone decarboxylase family protein [Gordonia]EMP10746.1 4-carboxymuconolactone decarboxylase [Gordonia sp. NB41Y]NDK88181.1 carboxymuconolactone decarboxylase family protein [Gordonia desulfuricans]WLP89158.1 carboxymuconolactone decarboxylase family protein [Gordonia sp. NB41Y]